MTVFEDMFEYLAGLLPDGWELCEPDMGIESLLEAPDGCVIEQDGRCPHGYVSPLRELGLV
jgi:hypothetical protein